VCCEVPGWPALSTVLLAHCLRIIRMYVRKCAYVEMNSCRRAKVKLLVAAATVHTLEVIRCWPTHFFVGLDRSPSSGIRIQVSVVRSEF